MFSVNENVRVKDDDRDKLQDLHLSDVLLEPQIAIARDREPIIEIHGNVDKGANRHPSEP